MAEDLKNLKKEIDQLKKEIKNLGGETFADMNKAIEAMGGGVNGAQKLIRAMTKDVDDLKDTFGNISTTLKNIVQDLKGAPDPVKETTKSFDKLESIARKISEHRKGEETLTVKQLKNVQKQTTAEVDRLKILKSTLNKNTEAYKEVNDVLNEKTGLLKDINEQVGKELETEKQIQKTLGVTGGLFKGITKSLEHIGIESEHFEHINKDLREAAKNGNSFKVLGAGVKSVGSSLKSAFSDPLVQIAAVGKLLHSIVEYANEFDHEIIKIQRDFGLTKNAAAEMNMELEHAAQHIGRTHKDTVQANADLNEFLGTSVMLSEKQLSDQIALTKNAGLEVDVREGIYKFSQLTGKTQEEIFDSIGKQNKGVLNNKKVLSEVAKTSGQLAAQYKNNPDLLGKAVVQAQKLGMTLEQTKRISQGLLNFEDSISAELEAELLTGQDLNLERARGLALQGDTAGAAEELMKNLGPNGLAKFQSMNVIQQEAYAKALGMSADELGDSLVKQKQLNNLDAQSRLELKKKVEELKAEGKSEKAAELERLAIKNKSVSLAEQELSNTEKQAEAAEQLKQSFNAFMVGPVTKAMDFFNNVMKTIADSKILQALVGGIGLAATAAGILMVGRSIISAFKSPLGSKSNPSHVIIEGNDGGSGGGGTRSRKGRKGRKGRGGKLAAAASVLGGVGLSDMVGDEDGVLDSVLEGVEDTVSGGSTPASKRAMPPRNPKTGRFMKAGGKTKGLKSLFKGKNLLKGLKGLKGLAGGAGGLIASLGVDYAAEQAKKSGNKKLGKGLDVAGGALTGASTGAMIGSIIPGVGTLIGGAIGGLIGGGMSYFGGDEPELAVGGIVNRPTRAIIGEAGAEAVIPLDKFYAKLDELISVVKAGGNVYMDSTKVGTAFGMSSFKTQ